MTDRRFGTLLLGVGILGSATAYLATHDEWMSALVSAFCCGLLSGVALGIKTERKRP